MRLEIKYKKLINFIFFVTLILFSENILNAKNQTISQEVLEKRSQKIYKGIRCLVCQNQSIEDSSAGLAKQLKSIVK